MIEEFKCSCCRIRYELTWDDNEDVYYSDVEELDDIDADDFDGEPKYCPFCGKHLCDEDYDIEFDD